MMKYINILCLLSVLWSCAGEAPSNEEKKQPEKRLAKFEPEDGKGNSFLLDRNWNQ